MSPFHTPPMPAPTGNAWWARFHEIMAARDPRHVAAAQYCRNLANGMSDFEAQGWTPPAFIRK